MEVGVDLFVFVGGAGSVVPGPPAAKRPTKDPMPLHRPTPDQYAAMMAAVAQGHGTLPRHISHLNGKPKIAHMTRTGSGRKPVISWMDAPDDVYFRATEGSKYVKILKYLSIHFQRQLYIKFKIKTLGAVLQYLLDS